LGQRQLYDRLFQVEEVEQRAGHMLENDDDVGNLWHHAHDQGDVRVAQNRLHHDFVLNLG
jgi:hypothetical protein